MSPALVSRRTDILDAISRGPHNRYSRWCRLQVGSSRWRHGRCRTLGKWSSHRSQLQLLDQETLPAGRKIGVRVVAESPLITRPPETKNLQMPVKMISSICSICINLAAHGLVAGPLSRTATVMGLPSQTNQFSKPNQYPTGPMPTSESSSAARPSLAASHAAPTAARTPSQMPS